MNYHSIKMGARIREIQAARARSACVGSAGGRNGHFDIAQGGQHDWNSWAPQLAAMAPDMTATIR